MVAVERKTEGDQRERLLASLKEMGSVKKALSRLVDQKQVEKEKILEVLKSEQNSYALPALHGRFRDKASDLGEIIKGFDEGLFEVSDLLNAAGIGKQETKSRGGFKGLFKR
jgi:hypothetical protein